MTREPVIPDIDECLDITGQASCLDMHIQLCLCYSLPESRSSASASAIQSLTNGLQALTRSFPWVAGAVVYEDPTKTHTGRRKIKSLGISPALVIKDLRDDPTGLTMEALREAEFPIRLLKEEVIAPIATYSGGQPGPKPVLILQGTLIRGGFILNVAGQHQAMDYPGLEQILHLLSKVCQGREFTPDEVASGNLSRYNLIPFLEESYQPRTELYRRIVTPVAQVPHENVRPSSWVNAIFDAASLAKLKSIAERDVRTPVRFISTDDALTAFVWKSVVRARLSRLPVSQVATLSRAVNIRHLFNIPEGHPGMVTQCVYDTATFGQLADEPLGVTASRLRSELDHEKTGLVSITRGVATMVHRSPDKRILNYMATLKTDVDLMFSSFAKVDAYGLDFNMGLGTPEAVRLPLPPADPGIVYVLPKRPDGQLVLSMCLLDTDLKRMQQDKDFVQFGRFIR
jgi:hypothetical protein